MSEDNNNRFQPYRYNSNSNREGLNISTNPSYHSRGERFTNAIGALVKKPAVATGILFVTAIIFGTVLFFGYTASNSDDNGAIPVIKADATPVRFPPDDRGGMHISNADSTIYDTMRGQNLDEIATVENLLEEEAPIEKAEYFDSETPDQGEVQTVASLEETTPMADTLTTPDAENTTTVAVQTDAQADKQAQLEKAAEIARIQDEQEKAKQEAEQIAKAKAEAEAKAQRIAEEKAAAQLASIQPAAGPANVAAGASQPTGEYYVQVASIQSLDKASVEWGKIQNKYGAVLSKASYRTKRADLGDKGVFHRIQAGPYTKERADAICSEIKTQDKNGCLVTR